MSELRCDIKLSVNGETVVETVDARKTLVDFLRDDLFLTGSHVGCEHGVCGAWGTLSAGIFNLGGTSMKIMGVQLLGISACFLWVFPTAFLLFKLIDVTIGLRVSAEEELDGLDFVEHGGNAYPDFDISHAGGVGAIGSQGLLKAEATSKKMLRKPVEQA